MDVFKYFNSQAAWLLPLVLVVLQFVMKSFVGQAASVPKVWENLLHSPVDLAFLSISLAIADFIASLRNALGLLVTLIVYVILVTVALVAWRLTPKSLNLKSILIAVPIMLANYCLALLMLSFSITLLTGHANGN